VTTRSVEATWQTGLRCVVHAGPFELIVDEPLSSGGTNRGPQPTDLLLASIASCFTLAVAYSATKRDVDLAGLRVGVTGTYDGPRFCAVRIQVSAAQPEGPALQQLIQAAERLCYVTNTLRRTPDIEIVASGD
jgi:putative redox protein